MKAGSRNSNTILASGVGITLSANTVNMLASKYQYNAAAIGILKNSSTELTSLYNIRRAYEPFTFDLTRRSMVNDNLITLTQNLKARKADKIKVRLTPLGEQVKESLGL